MKIDRLIGILSILLQEDRVTAPYLAETFEVSRRTIARDIEDLCRAGIPIATRQGRDGGISIMEGYRIDRTVLTGSDMEAILTGLTGLDSVSETGRYRQLMEKLSTVQAGNHILIDLSSWYKTTLAPKIKLLQEAMEENRRVRFRYSSPKGESLRTVEPATLIFKWSSWYLWGRCLQKEDFRLFKLNRMTGLQLTGEHFTPGTVPEPNLDAENFFPASVEVKAVFAPSARWRLIEEFGEDSFREQDDGSLLFSFGVGDEENLISWILTFGAEAELLEPEWARQRLAGIIGEMQKKYKK